MFQSQFKEQSPSEFNIEKYLEDDKQNKQSYQLPCTSISLFVLLGFFFIIMGITTLVSNYQQNLVQIQLKQEGLILSTQPTYVSFVSDSVVDVYLKIQKLTQFDYKIGNPLRQGDYFMKNSDICGKYKNNGNLNKKISITGSKLEADSVAYPCGLFLGMFPEGTIEIYINNSSIMLNQSDLTYFPQEIDQILIDPSKQWANSSDPFFKTWMSMNSAITTTKLIGKLNGNFQGYFSLQIKLKNALAMPYDKPLIVLSSEKFFGNSGIPFCIVAFCQSGFLFLFAFVLYFFNSILSADLKKSKFQPHQIELKSTSQAVSIKIGEI